MTRRITAFAAALALAAGLAACSDVGEQGPDTGATLDDQPTGGSGDEGTSIGGDESEDDADADQDPTGEIPGP